MLGLNCGSGQRPFDRSAGWVNIDIQPRWNPDIVADWNDLSMFKDETVDYVVSEHSIEHVGLGECDGFFKEAYRVLKPSGSLIVTTPDLRALCQRWLLRQIDDYTFGVNMWGAYMGDEADRHKWLWPYEGWVKQITQCADWKRVGKFNFREIGHVRLSSDWWILGIEATKHKWEDH